MREIAEIKFAKVHPEAVIPSKREEDMGFDIYACFDEDYIAILPHETKLIPTGIASSFDSKYGIVLKERGSTGSKGIALRAGIIDSGYRNEWFVGLTNTTDNLLCITKVSNEEAIRQHCLKELKVDLAESTIEKIASHIILENMDNITFYPYSKAIAQALVLPVPPVRIKEISYDELKAIESERGMGALGSSNK